MKIDDITYDCVECGLVSWDIDFTHLNNCCNDCFHRQYTVDIDGNITKREHILEDID